MKTISLNICILLLLLFTVSCYEDKGNYEYTDINEVDFEWRNVYGVKLEDTTLVLRADVAQSISQDQSNLSFLWLRNKVTENAFFDPYIDTLSQTEEARLEIKATDKDFTHYIRLGITDRLTGVTRWWGSRVNVVKPYEGVWMVLHKQDNETRLGAVEYMGDEMLVNPDVLYKESGRKLRGEPKLLMNHWQMNSKIFGNSTYRENIFFLGTDDMVESGIYYQTEKFAKKDSLIRQVEPNAMITFANDYTHVMAFQGGQDGHAMIADSTLYQGPAGGFKFFKAKINTDLVTGDVKLTHLAKCGFTSFCFDQAGHRFLFYNHNASRSSSTYDHTVFTDRQNAVLLTYIPQRTGDYAKIDLRNVPEDQKMVYMGPGFQYLLTGVNGNRYEAYAFMNGANDKSYVYIFDVYGFTNNVTAFKDVKEIKTPMGVDENTLFASTKAFGAFLFYAVEDKVYRLDFTLEGGVSTVIYQHTGGRASKMKFAKPEHCTMTFPTYDFPATRSLGVVFDMPDGNSELVVLNLSVAGRVSDEASAWPTVQVHKGFGKITDMVFI